MPASWWSHVPAWSRTIRFRLTLTYSALVFGIAALLLAGLYVALSGSIAADPLDESAGEKFYVTEHGTVKFLGGDAESSGEFVSASDLDVVQRAVNAGTLDTLRTYSFAAVVALFLLSLAVGWWLSGRVLRPVGAITRTAREISSSDLSRRIGASGPPDELRELADTIDEMLARLEQAFENQRALVDDVSHELRNPVAVIQANVDAVLSDEDATVESRRRAATVVSGATTSITRLVEDLLATARRRSGAFAEAEVDLATLARAVVEEFRSVAAERDLRWSTRLTARTVVYADAHALTRAVRNLVANAVRFSPDGGLVTVAAGSRSGWVWVAVRDEGPGIEAEHQGRIFDRFYSVPPDEEAAGPRERGHGIGLAIARQVVEAHDGRLTLRSTPGLGSTFVIWLPERTSAAPGRRDLPPEADPLD